MILSIEIISEDVFTHLYLNINKETLLDIKQYIEQKTNIKINNQEWYFKDNKINNNFKPIEGDYFIYTLTNENISFFLNYNNQIIKTPYVSKYIDIKELKDILSIKDNIYLKNIKLNNANTLEYYNINNNTELKILNSISIKSE